MSARERSTSRAGFSLVEVLVAMTLLSVVLLSLVGAAGLSLSQMSKARQDVRYSADAQQVADSLVAKGWNNVSSGSATVRGRSVVWTVTAPNANSQKIAIVLQRRGMANTSTVYSDTLTIFLAKSQVQ